MKTLTILDCYIHDENILNKLESFIDLLKSKDKTILLISNSLVPENIQNKIDYFFYDSNNPMFSEDWKFYNTYTITSDMGDFTSFDTYPQLQPHGLSVMINLYRGIHIAKELGFTHFEKLEYDPIFSNESFNEIINLPNKCLSSNKKSLFFLNDRTVPEDFSFHYFFSEINFFLENTTAITCEEDYKSVIYKSRNNNIFIGVERFLYESVSHLDKNDIYLIDENRRDLIFKNVYWNSEISRNNLPKKYKNCGTRIYRIVDKNNQEINSYVNVLSHNFSNNIIERKIDCHFNDGVIYTVYHNLSGKGSFSYSSLTPNLTHIDVYENNELIYTEHITDCQNILKFK
jgi:hypothetical protein